MTDQAKSRTGRSRAMRFLAAFLCAAALSFPAGGARAQTPFYHATAHELAGPPGSLIRSEPMMFAPAGAQAYRVLYRSVGMQGEPIAVSGVIVVPPGPAPAGGRPIVAWAHPTTGVVPHCAPSLAIFVFQQMAGLRQLIEQGAVVAATDYPGLGTSGPHPYLVGDSEARAVINSVRAARSLPGVGDGNSFAVWGHSQGGQASLYTGLIARTYAPELRLVGVSAAAPATSLVTLMGDDFKSSGGKNLTAMTLWSWSRVYGAPIDNVVVPEAMPTVDRLSNECIEFDLRHPRAPADREAARAPIPFGAEHRYRAALALAGDTQHAGYAAAADPAVSGPGHHGQHRPAGSHPRLYAAAMQGRRQGRHDVGARCRSRLCRQGQRRCRGGLDDGPVRGAARAQRLRQERCDR